MPARYPNVKELFISFMISFQSVTSCPWRQAVIIWYENARLMRWVGNFSINMEFMTVIILRRLKVFLLKVGFIGNSLKHLKYLSGGEPLTFHPNSDIGSSINYCSRPQCIQCGPTNKFKVKWRKMRLVWCVLRSNCSSVFQAADLN